jgi:cation/acetate symporter
VTSRFTILVVAVLVAFALSVLARLRSTRTAVDFQLAGRRVGVITNACAICGDYVSAASFLGVAAAVYAIGLDGAWYATGFAAGFLPVLLFIAAPLRRFGDRSIPDFLGRRFESETVRIIAVAVTQIIILAYLVPQAVGGGLTWELFTDIALPGLTPYSTGIVASTVLTGFLVVIGGMRGTTWNQAVQFIVLLGILVWVSLALVADGFSYGSAVAELNAQPMLNPDVLEPNGTLTATDNRITGLPARFAEPGARYDGIGQFALMVTLVFGTAGLPHVMNRFFTSPTGRAARMTTVWVIALIGVFYAAAVMVGTAARSVLQTQDEAWLESMTVQGVLKTPEHALLALGRVYGGEVGLSTVTTGALLAIMSTIGGLLLASSVSWGHDLYERYVNPRANRVEALRAGQLAVVIMTVLAAVSAMVLNPARFTGSVPSVVASLVTTAFAVAGCTLTPALLLAIWSRRITAAGVAVGMVVGAITGLSAVTIGLLGDGTWTLFQTPTVLLGPVVVTLMMAVSLATRPVPDLATKWMAMHGSAGDRNAERLARVTVESGAEWRPTSTSWWVRRS